MIRKNLLDLPSWSVLGQNIYTLEGKLLLSKGNVLKPMVVDKLIAAGIIEVYLENSGEDISLAPFKSPDLRFEEAFMAGQVIVRDIMDRVSAGRPIDRNDLDEAVNVLYPEVINTGNMLRQLAALRTKDEYTLQHSIAVGIYGLKICQLLGWPEKKCKQVGKAGIMHDIGKVKTPDEILNKPDALDGIEWEQLKRHPQLGYEILRSSEDIEYEIQLAVLQHHERLDGGGYPLGMRSNNLHLFSKILAVADAFDAMTSDRSYRQSLPTFKASQELMVEAYSGRMTPGIVVIFVDYLLDMSPGQKVLLNTEQIAEIVLPNKAEPNRPLVQTEGEFINLEKNRAVWIEAFYKDEG